MYHVTEIKIQKSLVWIADYCSAKSFEIQFFKNVWADYETESVAYERIHPYGVVPKEEREKLWFSSKEWFLKGRGLFRQQQRRRWVAVTWGINRKHILTCVQESWWNERISLIQLHIQSWLKFHNKRRRLLHKNFPRKKCRWKDVVSSSILQLAQKEGASCCCRRFFFCCTNTMEWW